MIILVDYDNIPIGHRKKGLDYVTDTIVRCRLGYDLLKGTARVFIRLYAGWYKLNKLTKEAQRLSARIQKDYPKPFNLIEEKNKHTVTVNIELAYSLAIDPSKRLWHTYRTRGLPPNIECLTPNSVCTNAQCPLQTVYNFFKNRNCPQPGCSVKPEDILQRPEQKLVDTMITTDLIHYATTGKQDLCIVTSDDDLWPGITSALLNGARIVHIHTHSQRRTPPYYSKGTGNAYIQKNL